jgi:Zn-dependent membrane protease YugP
MPADLLFWLLVLPGMALGAYAQSSIRYSVTKYSRVPALSGATGAQVARYLLDARGLNGVPIEPTEGVLSDHYDPRSQTLRLSQSIFYTPSIAAIGIAAHEAGHAIQDADDYFALEFRSLVVPLVQLSAQIAPWVFIGGLILDLPRLAWVGAILFGASTFFALVTLPVEFDASRRALDQLVKHRIITDERELAGVRAVLRSAAWSYVAAAVSAIGTWVFYLILVFGRGGSNRV